MLPVSRYRAVEHRAAAASAHIDLSAVQKRGGSPSSLFFPEEELEGNECVVSGPSRSRCKPWPAQSTVLEVPSVPKERGANVETSSSSCAAREGQHCWLLPISLHFSIPSSQIRLAPGGDSTTCVVTEPSLPRRKHQGAAAWSKPLLGSCQTSSSFINKRSLNFVLKVWVGFGVIWGFQVTLVIQCRARMVPTKSPVCPLGRELP